MKHSQWTAQVTRFRAACRLIKNDCPDTYAKAYATRGMDMQTEGEISSQIDYLLSNIRYWRGLEAKHVKSELKAVKEGIGE